MTKMKPKKAVPDNTTPSILQRTSLTVMPCPHCGKGLALRLTPTFYFGGLKKPKVEK